MVLGGEHAVEPELVVLPHAFVRDGVDGSPEWFGFFGFGGGAGVGGCDEDGDVHGEAVGELEPEFAAFDGVDGGDVEFFLGFADGAVEFAFVGVEFAAGAVDFALSEAAFFADEEDA